MEDVQHQVMGYDRAATMFAPDGHILQVEYAEKTVRLGSPSIGIVCKDGVILISDRRQKDVLIIESSLNKVSQIDEHIMCVVAGILSDARVLIDRARLIAQQHRVTYDSPAHTEAIVKEIADIKQQFTQYGGARPFGTSLMIAGVNSEAELFVTDVTGNYLKYKAWAIGEDDEKLREKLREKYKEGLTCEEGIKLALAIFKEVYGDKFEKERFDIGIIKKDTKKIEMKNGKDF
ncbi:MAG: archaeal proteasome endopeptidase complex subunit alpha [Candidatus Pacearchaeota archaeon]